MLMKEKDDAFVDFLSDNILFHHLDNETLGTLSAFFTLVEYDRGAFIINQGELDESLFFILSGKIRLTLQVAGRGEVLKAGIIERGDLLNYEMLEPGIKAPYSARALTPVSIAKIDRRNLRIVVKQFPELYQPLSVLYQSHKMAVRKGSHTRFAEESIYFLARRHPIHLVFSLLLPLFFAAITLPLINAFYRSTEMTSGLLLFGLDLFIVLAWIVWCIIDWVNDYAVITSRRVLFEEKVMFFYHSQHESPMSAILSVTAATSLLGRLFAYGDILVKTYTGLIVLPGQKNPSLIVDIIETLWSRNKTTNSVHEKEEVQTTLRRELGLPIIESEGVIEEEQPIDEYSKTGSLLSALANVFSLIKEEENQVTYWTHWIFLIKGLSLPTVLFLALLTFSIYRTSGLINFLSDPSFYLLFSVLLSVTLAWLLYKYFDWRNDYYVISDEQILDVYKKPLGREEKNSAQIKNILSIEYKRLGIIGLLLNYGTVYIRVGDSTLTFDNVYNPAFIQQALFRRMETLEQKSNEERQISERNRMAEMIAAYHQMVSKENQSPLGQEDDVD